MHGINLYLAPAILAVTGFLLRHAVRRARTRATRRRDPDKPTAARPHPYLAAAGSTMHPPRCSCPPCDAALAQTPTPSPAFGSSPMTKNHTHPEPGPIDLQIEAGAADVRILASSTGRARVTVHTDATDGPAHTAVRDAVLLSNDRRLSVTVPKNTANSFNTSSTYGSTTVLNNFSGRSITQIDGRTFVDGIETGTQQSEKIAITAEVPAGTNIDVRVTVGDVTVEEIVGSAHVRTGTGSILVNSAAGANLKTGVGDVTLGTAVTSELESGTGDIKVDAVRTVKATTGVGAIRVRDVAGRAEARTAIGDIKITYSGPFPPITHTGLGKTRTVKINPTDRV